MKSVCFNESSDNAYNSVCWSQNLSKSSERVIEKALTGRMLACRAAAGYSAAVKRFHQSTQRLQAAFRRETAAPPALPPRRCTDTADRTDTPAATD